MGHGRRTWAVLGEMLELGAESIPEHEALGRLAVRLNVSRLVAVGEGTQPIDSGARQRGLGRRGVDLGPGHRRRLRASRGDSLPRVTWCCSSPAVTRAYGGSEIVSSTITGSEVPS